MRRTKEVSQLVGVSGRTLQYYNDEGLLTLGRTENNHRLYDKEALERIWQIMIYKEMGLELKEIKELLQIPEEKREECLRLQAQTVESKIEKLKGQIDFISLILVNGMPQAPEDDKEMTYVKSIEELRRLCRERKTNKEEDDADEMSSVRCTDER